MKHLSKLALLAAAFFTGLSANAQSIKAFGGRSVTISSDQNCTMIYVFDRITLTVNQGVTLTLNISNGNSFNLFDNSTLQLHGTLAGSVASGATWYDNTYINVYLSDGAKYTVTGLTCMDGDNYLRYYGYDAATDGNGTVSVTSGSTAVTASSIGYKTTTYTFTATPASGYKFKNWTKGAGGEVLGTDASINVTCEQNGQYQVYANFEEDAPATFSVTVAWDKTSKTGTFNMPGGNVTLEPEYYPQATLAFQGLTAAVDAAAKTEAPLAVLADGAVTGGTLMYYVATDKNFSQADAIALAETQWSADIPTAETIEAAGTCYVWYYIKGDAEHSDTDPVPLAVTLLPEPTYAVEFAEGTDPNEWTASPNAGVTKGQPVTVTYNGSKKVIGVKAEKKATTPSLNITNPTVGQVIGSDGKNYNVANVPTGVTAVAMIAYVSGSNGLAIALADEGSLNWETAKSTCEAKTPAFSNGTWKLPSQDEWKQMFSANGGNEESYDGLNTAITTAGGTAFQDDTVKYWSSSENDSDKAYLAQFYYGYPLWFSDLKVNDQWVRACLAF